MGRNPPRQPLTIFGLLLDNSFALPRGSCAPPYSRRAGVGTSLGQYTALPFRPRRINFCAVRRFAPHRLMLPRPALASSTTLRVQLTKWLLTKGWWLSVAKERLSLAVRSRQKTPRYTKKCRVMNRKRRSAWLGEVPRSSVWRNAAPKAQVRRGSEPPRFNEGRLPSPVATAAPTDQRRPIRRAAPSALRLGPHGLPALQTQRQVPPKPPPKCRGRWVKCRAPV